MKYKLPPEFKNMDSVTSTMILAESSGLTHDELGEVFVKKVKQIRNLIEKEKK